MKIATNLKKLCQERFLRHRAQGKNYSWHKGRRKLDHPDGCSQLSRQYFQVQVQCILNALFFRNQDQILEARRNAVRLAVAPVKHIHGVY